MFTQTRNATMVLLSFMLIITGCTSQEEKWANYLAAEEVALDAQIKRLEQHLENGTIRNAKLLNQYAKVVSTLKPELSEIVYTLAADATGSGPLYQGLLARVEEVKPEIKVAPKQGANAVNQLNDEIQTIKEAASPNSYAMMLTDPINVLADMSNGTLARVEAMSKEASLQANGAKDYGAGSQLVGNPSYGEWRTNSSGASFWAFYGQYRLLSDLWRGPVYYNSWAGNRGYSYFNDVGRNHYTSRAQRSQMQQVETRTRKNFQRQGKTFNSPYAKNRRGSNSTTRRSVARSPKKFSSAYAKRGSSPFSSSSRSRYGSRPSYNSRNMTMSRSSRGGK